MEEDGAEDFSDIPRPLLKSVSAPTHRGKGFVRPNCSTTFWLQCPVCCRRYFKYESHLECFSRWCEICQDALPTQAALQHHAMTYHRKNYCGDCNHVYENIRGHKTYEHSSTSGAVQQPTLTKPKKTRMARATTDMSSINSSSKK